MRVQIFGDAALLLTFDEADVAPQRHEGNVSVLECVLNAKSALEQHPIEGIRELIPAAETLTVVLDTASGVRQGEIAKQLRTADFSTHAALAHDASVVEIPVVYQGEDLPRLAAHFGVSEAELIHWHQAVRWRAAFGGFAPGFMYMVPQGFHHHTEVDIDLEHTPVPRLDSPRTAIPAGSVALAGNFSSVYPQRSPGGWQLIGHTNIPMFDLTQQPPSLLRPGDEVAFRAIDAGDQ